MITVLFGTQSGNAKNLALVLGESLAAHSMASEVIDMGELDPETIHKLTYVLIVTSTYGDGEPPDNASEWMSFLKFNEDVDLGHLKFAVIGLGDTYYPHFCQCGKDFEHYLTKRGANALIHRLDCDLYYEEQYSEWFQQFIHVLKNDLQE